MDEIVDVKNGADVREELTRRGYWKNLNGTLCTTRKGRRAADALFVAIDKRDRKRIGRIVKGPRSGIALIISLVDSVKEGAANALSWIVSDCGTLETWVEDGEMGAQALKDAIDAYNESPCAETLEMVAIVGAEVELHLRVSSKAVNSLSEN